MYAVWNGRAAVRVEGRATVERAVRRARVVAAAVVGGQVMDSVDQGASGPIRARRPEAAKSDPGACRTART